MMGIVVGDRATLREYCPRCDPRAMQPEPPSKPTKLTAIPPPLSEDDQHALKEANAILLGIGETGYVMTHPNGPHTALGKAATAAMGRSGYVELCKVDESSGGHEPPTLVVVVEVPAHLFKAGQEVTATIEAYPPPPVAALPPPPLEEPNPLQSELLDLIVLMPDAQVDDLVAFITKLREARRFNTRPPG